MRLLHTRELRFEEFFDDDIPKYAILSHTWGSDEVSYEDFLAGRKKGGAGYAKIVACCKYAVKDDQAKEVFNPFGDGPWDWVWIDTCCINKSSSAELTEAINSMHSWYGQAGVCYAYLSDVTKSDDMEDTMSKFRASRWFTRGWTLQELVLPRNITFLDNTWNDLGTGKKLTAEITKICRIDENRFQRRLSSSSPISSATVAEKLSWAATRQTTRREDQAYCLLGLFEMNLSLFYGEGDRSFRRLQEEIIKSSKDESIFVWGNWIDHMLLPCGVLSPVISNFGMQHLTHPSKFKKFPLRSRNSYSITNQGLEFRVPRNLAQRQDFLLPLNSQYHEKGPVIGAYAIRLKKSALTGNWERDFSPSPSSLFCQPWSDTLPALYHTPHVLRNESFGGLWFTPVQWVWTREDLDREGSELITITTHVEY